MATVSRNQSTTAAFFDATQWDAALGAGSDLRIPYDVASSFSSAMSSATAFNSLIVENGKKVGIGSGATPLSIRIDAGGTKTFKYLGSGPEVYIAPSTEITTIDWSPSTRAKLVVQTSGTVKNLYLATGTVEVTADVTIDAGTGTIVVTGGDVTIRKDSAGTNVVPTIIVTGGTVTIERDFAALTVGGNAVVTIDAPTLTVGASTLYGGTLKIVSGNCGALTAYGGTLDESGVIKSVTGGALTMYEGTVRVKSPGPTAVSWASETTYGRGPTIRAGR